jgi:CTP:molybdopterin cytidylyltransferase MocA
VGVSQVASIPGILLSAGRSIRFGSEKLLTALPTGGTLFERALRVHLQSQVTPLVVVVSPSLGEIIIEKASIFSFSRIEIKEEAGRWHTFSSRWGRGRLIINQIPKEGISSSIRTGLRCLEDGEKENGVLISLADLPHLRCEAINLLIKEFLKKKVGIVVPAFNNVTGHPVIVDMRQFGEDIDKIKGDIGLRILMKKYPEMVRKIPWKDDSVTWDIDDLGDLERLL